jgi:hypothetical protein
MAEKTATKKRPARQQMLETLAESEKAVTEHREAAGTPEQKLTAKAITDAVAATEELSSRGVVQSIGELKSSIGRLLGELSDRLEEQVARYTQVQRAIAAKDQELKDIYEIQRSASTLTALIDAHAREREKMEQEITASRVQLEREITQTREAWEQEKRQREAEIKERDTAEQKRRDREREEYRYSFSREQQQAKDQFADQMAKAQKEWDERKAKLEADIAQRQQTIKIQEQQANELRQKVEAFPKELEAVTARVIKETTARLQQEAAAREQLLKQEFEGQKNVQSTRIASLEQQVAEQAERLAKVLGQAEKAYAQVQEIAVRAIEGSASAKQLAHLQQLLADQGRKPTPER